MRVQCKPELWEGFIQRCKDEFPDEYVEAIHGREIDDSYLIEAFHKMESEGSTDTADYTNLEVSRQKHLASKNGRLFLGTVHTHPSIDLDLAPSDDDHMSGHSDGEKLMGIVRITIKKGRRKKFVIDVKWWVPQKPLEFVLTPDVPLTE